MLHHETHSKLNEPEILEAAKAGAHVGYCLACGHSQPCDPDDLQRQVPALPLAAGLRRATNCSAKTRWIVKPLTGRKKNIALALFALGWLLSWPLGYGIAQIIIHLEK